MKKIIALFLSFSLLLALGGCAQAPARTKDIAVLYTGDVHCALEGDLGYSQLAAFRSSLEQEGAEVLLVDTGDAIQGAPLAKLSVGEIPIDIMNQLGYDAMAVGNHEFDFGLTTLTALSKRANFPFLSLNFVENQGQKPAFAPYTLIERDGVTIAFLGITTPYTLRTSSPTYFQDEQGNFLYNFLEDSTGETLWNSVQATVDQVKQEGADIVIALSHLGVSAEQTPFLSTTMIANTTGIDVVLDGHSHSTLPSERVRNQNGDTVLLSATGFEFSSIGYLLLDKKGNLSTGLVTEYDQEEAAITAFIDQCQSDFDDLLQQPVTSITHDFITADPVTQQQIIRSQETNLGNLCADSIRSATGADIAVQNSGGIRNQLLTGNITYSNLLQVLPFSNDLYTIEVTGQHILDALELSVSAAPADAGAFLQVSGMQFTYSTHIPSPVKMDIERMVTTIEGPRRVQTVQIGDTALDADATYSLAGVEYLLLLQGDGYSMFADCPVLAQQTITDTDALFDYMRTDYHKNIASYTNLYGTGRIVAVP